MPSLHTQFDHNGEMSVALHAYLDEVIFTWPLLERQKFGAVWGLALPL